MSRVPRSSLPDGYFHVYARGIARPEPLFGSAADRDTFVGLLRRIAPSNGWSCHALCVMSSHYHLVVETTRVSLSTGLQQLNWRYALHVNQTRAGFGHVFADRYSVRMIESEEYLHDACAYVLLNPVKAGLCDRAEDWPWSVGSRGLLTR